MAVSGIKVDLTDQEAKSGDGGYLPAGLFHVVITEVESAESQSEANPGKPLLKFTSVVQDGPHADRTIKWTACCWTGALYTIVGLLKAMGEYEELSKGGGLTIPDAQEFYVGKHVMARRGINKKAKAENPEDDPLSWLEVKGFQPYKEGAQSVGTQANAKASVLP
jgi:hypothetical protein